MEEDGEKWVVLVPWPFQGHITPMLQLGTVLHSKGFSIIFAHTKFNSPNSSHHPDFLFLPIPDNLSENDPLVATPFSLISVLNKNCKAPFQECLVQMIDNQKKKKSSSSSSSSHRVISCIISDTLMGFAADVANNLNIPSIVLHTTNASTAVSYSHIPRLHAQGLIPVQDSALEELVPELHPLRFKDLPISRFVAIEDLVKLLNSIGRRRTPSAIVWNTMDDLEHESLAWLQQHCPCKFFPIGPLHKFAVSASTASLRKEESSCMSWLDKQEPNSVIYVSLGSIAAVDDEKALAEMAWGLANSNQPFLWVLRQGLVRGSTQWIELLPENFKEVVGERGCFVKWAPQKEVLAHKAVGGFWSHCGWNSTLESICEGVPMICWPSFGDQKVNARYLSCDWGMGIELGHDAGRREIERAVRRLLADEEGKEIRRRAIEFKLKADVSMRKGGSSFDLLNALVEHIKE